ncbi:MAG: J domain-containing protein, partial [Myxococcales bacterium]
MSEEKIPRQVEDADVRALDITAQEAFIHACIDGVLNVDDIADLTVSSPAQVLESIERLVSLSAVEWVERKVSSAPPVTELVEDVEIDGVLQEKILEAFRRADKLNHYELLGVAIDAERAEIRKAYFALSKTFHPDAYYGKHLGSFKSKMEVVFRKVTDAYEAVGRPKKREAYDRYLKQSIAVSAAEQQMGRVEQRAQAIAQALTKAPVAERLAQPIAATPDARAWSSGKAPAKSVPSVAPGTAEFDRMQRKRELLERKLRG